MQKQKWKSEEELRTTQVESPLRCQDMSSVRVRCSHGNYKEIPIGCGRIERCLYCRSLRLKRIRYKIFKGQDDIYQDQFQMITLTDDPKTSKIDVGEDNYWAKKANEQIMRFDKLRRTWRFELVNGSKYRDADRFSLRTISRQQKDCPDDERGVSLAQTQSKQAWFRVIEKAEAGKAYKTPLNQTRYGKGHVHLHVLLRNFMYPVVDKKPQAKWDEYIAELEGKNPAVRYLHKQIRKAGFGSVFNVQNERVNGGFRKYLSLYLGNKSNRIKNENGTYYRMYGSSNHWNLDKLSPVTKWQQIGFQSHQMASGELEFLPSCTCGNTDKRHNDWLKVIEKGKLKKELFESFAVGRDLVNTRDMQIVPKKFMDKVIENKLRKGEDYG